MLDTSDNIGSFRSFLERAHRDSEIFKIGPNELGVFEPEAARKINALNFADLTLPDRPLDVLLGRRSKAVSWKSVRSAFAKQMRHLADETGVEHFALRMRALLDQRLNRHLDLVLAIQEVCSQSLIPIVLANLSPIENDRILRDQNLKIFNLLQNVSLENMTLADKFRSVYIQIAAGWVVRRELRRRFRGMSSRRLDLADPIVDMLSSLGIGRAVDAVTAVLTAIAGPPGAMAACLVYELSRQSSWRERLADELAGVPYSLLHRSPAQTVPLSYRFVKEALRMWSPPLILSRTARTACPIGDETLEVGQQYLLSPHIIHRNPRYWKNPDVFDPDRWLDESLDKGAAYVPFGWAPRACVGANLGIIQLLLLCHMMCTRYRITLDEPAESGVALGVMPIPRSFKGSLSLQT